jgi:hypothetical protein
MVPLALENAMMPAPLLAAIAASLLSLPAPGSHGLAVTRADFDLLKQAQEQSRRDQENANKPAEAKPPAEAPAQAAVVPPPTDAEATPAPAPPSPAAHAAATVPAPHATAPARDMSAAKSATTAANRSILTHAPNTAPTRP